MTWPVVQSTPSTVEWQPLDSVGEHTDPGTVTVTVTTSAGVAVITDGATSGTGTGARSFGLTAAQTSTLDLLSVLWRVAGATVHTSTVEIVGGLYFGNAELRARATAVADQAKFTSAAIVDARQRVEALFESVTGVAWVPRFASVTVPGTGSVSLIVPHVALRRVRSVELLDDTQTVTETFSGPQLAEVRALGSGMLWRAAGWVSCWVRVSYEHGHDAPFADVRAAAMTLARLTLTATRAGLPENATNFTSTELGWSAVLITPGVRGAHTSDGSVNEVLDRRTFVTVGVA
jgi:hypothetical protein